jgi:hypothetical protein
MFHDPRNNELNFNVMRPRLSAIVQVGITIYSLRSTKPSNFIPQRILLDCSKIHLTKAILNTKK